MDASSTLTTTTSLEVGHYRIVRLLGRGGMGNVYLARDTRLGRLVALKFLSTELLDSADVRRQFDLEAKTTASLSHPNVVTLFDLGEQDGRPWVALEYIEGCTLAQRMNEDWPSPAETLRIGLAVAHAVAAAHAAGIVHRDLKPANVLLGVDGRPRVLDFGIARFTNRRSEPPPPEGLVPEVEFLGTPSYMAPEQWHGLDSPATDIWALGLILYQLLTQTHPFRGLDTVQIVARVGAPEPLEPPPELHAASSDLAPIVMRCLSKLPADRPTAAELCAELEALEARQRVGKPSESPFRGLLPFSERHAHLFFGRDREVSSFVERLRAQSVLVVVGASGAGKSSLVLAGVVPRLKETGHHHVIVVRPQGSPLLALAEAVLLPVASSSGKSSKSTKEADTVVDAFRARPGQPELRTSSPKELAAELAVSPGRLAVLLGELATRTESRVLLMVDQLEEVCTVAQDEAERRAFMSAICTASGHPDEPVRVIMTVRDDFLGRIPWGAEGRAALAGIVLVSAPEPDAIREILKMPLLQTGYDFDDPALLDEIVTSVRGEAACLPLLQFAMSLLWTRRDETRHLLLKEVYTSMGGVGGALATHAENVVSALDPTRVELCRQVVLRLVTGEGTRRAVDRAALVEGLPEEAHGLLSILLDARLLSQQRGDEGRVELAHESLTRVWRRLARWIEESHEDLALAGDLVASSERWARRGKRSDELWQGDALRDAARLVARGKAALPPMAISLIEASLRRERRGIRRRRAFVAALAMAALVAVTASSMAAWAWRGRQRDATVAKRRAEQASSLLLEERALASYESGDPHSARAQLRAALEVRDSVSLRNLARKLEKEPLLATLPNDSVVYDAQLLPDGRTIAAANQSGIVELYDLHTLERRVLRGHTDQVLGLAILDDGRFVSASWNGEIRLWNPTTGTGEALLQRTNVTSLVARGSTVAISRDREILLVETGRPLRTIPIDVVQPRGLAFDTATSGIFVGGDDGRLRLVDISSETEVRRSVAGPAIGRIAVDASGEVVVVTRRNGNLTIFDRKTLVPKLEFSAHAGDARGLAISRSGRIWSGGMDHRLVEWDSGTGSARQELPTRLVGITSLTLAADERSLVASGPGGIEVWNVSGEAMAPSLLPHADPVLDLAFGPDGSRLASGSPRRILVWNVASGHPTVELRREGTRCRDIAYDPKNGRMAATDDHGQIAFWEIPSGRSMGTMGARSTIPFALAYSPQNDLAAVSTNEKTLLVYSLDRRELLHELRGHEADVRGVALAADGKTLYSASFDGTVRAWNLANGSNKVLYRRIGRNYGLTLSKDGKTLVVTGLEGVAVAIDLSSNLAKPLGPFQGRLYRPAISPDGRTVALPSSDGNTYLVDLASGARRALSGHHGEVNTAAFSPDGRLLATGGDDHTVRLFDTVTGKPIWGGGADHVPPSAELPKEPGTTYALRLGGQLVVGFDNGMVEVRPSVETEPRRLVVPLQGTPTQAVTLLALGPSSTLAVGFADGSFGVWDPETGHLLERVFLHGRVVELVHANGIVTAKSELGDSATIDLGILARDYCPLMSDLYKSLPFVWRDGTVRVEAPKARCTPL